MHAALCVDDYLSPLAIDVVIFKSVITENLSKRQNAQDSFVAAISQGPI